MNQFLLTKFYNWCGYFSYFPSTVATFPYYECLFKNTLGKEMKGSGSSPPEADWFSPLPATTTSKLANNVQGSYKTSAYRYNLFKLCRLVSRGDQMASMTQDINAKPANGFQRLFSVYTSGSRNCVQLTNWPDYQDEKRVLLADNTLVSTQLGMDNARWSLCKTSEPFGTSPFINTRDVSPSPELHNLAFNRP